MAAENDSDKETAGIHFNILYLEAGIQITSCLWSHRQAENTQVHWQLLMLRERAGKTGNFSFLSS